MAISPRLVSRRLLPHSNQSARTTCDVGVNLTSHPNHAAAHATRGNRRLTLPLHDLVFLWSPKFLGNSNLRESASGSHSGRSGP